MPLTGTYISYYFPENPATTPSLFSAAIICAKRIPSTATPHDGRLKIDRFAAMSLRIAMAAIDRECPTTARKRGDVKNDFIMLF